MLALQCYLDLKLLKKYKAPWSVKERLKLILYLEWWHLQRRKIWEAPNSSNNFEIVL